MISVESQTKKVTPQPPYQPLGWSYRYVYIALEAQGEPRGGPGRAQGETKKRPRWQFHFERRLANSMTIQYHR